MKKYAALAIAAASVSTAHAQSSVTLYGIVDAGFVINTNSGGKPLRALTGGNQSANRFGFTGAEDLGGGLKAIFTLENGFNSANGTLASGLLFGRQAFVGLSGRYGSVTLGRQYATLSSFLGPFEAGSDWAARGTGYAYHPGGLDDIDGSERANNSIKFTSATFSGFQVGGLYSLGGVSGNTTQNEIISFGVNYGYGPFKAAAAYLYAKNPNFSLFGNNATSNAPTSANANNITSPVFSGYASAASQQVIGAGASYVVGPATLGVLYSNTKLNDIGGTSINGVKPAAGLLGSTATFNTGEVNLKYMVTPSLLLGAEYAYTKTSAYIGKSGASYQQVNAGADYFLSKLTDLYLMVLHEKAAGTDSTGKAAVAALTFATPSNSNQQTVVTFGIRHLF